MIKKLLYLSALFIGTMSAYAQQCGTDKHNHDHSEETEQINRNVRERLLLAPDTKNARLLQEEQLVIPIVVHIVHDTGTLLGEGENRTDQEIKDILEEINDLLAHKSGATFSNPYSGVNANIKFALAARDPEGNATTGIVRHPDNVNSTDNYDNVMKNTYAWPTDSYFNLYLVKDICEDGTCGQIYGYANYPWAHGQKSDGAVFLGASFWSGLTLHEMGHYLGLAHNFSGGCKNDDCTLDGDGICDTPPKTSAGGAGKNCVNSNNCDADEDDTSENNPFRSISLGGLGNMDDGNENYMDYSGGCWAAFTQGQKAKMRSILQNERASLFTNDVLVPPVSTDAKITSINNNANKYCESSFAPKISVQNNGGDTIKSLEIALSIDGNLQETTTWNGNIAYGQNTEITLPALSFNENNTSFSIEITKVNNTIDENLATNILSANFRGTVQLFPLETDFETGAIDSEWQVLNPDDDTEFKVTNKASGHGIGNYSIYFSNYIDARNTTDRFVSPLMSFETANTGSIEFDVAHAGYSESSNDGLMITVSKDCGLTWNPIWTKEGTDLNTAPFVTSSFIPKADQWKNYKIPFDTSVVGHRKIMIAFENVPDYGNNLYLDNIKIFSEGVISAYTESDESTLSIWPNPVQEILNTNLNGLDASWTIYNTLGEIILEGNKSPINTSTLGTGVYMIQINHRSARFVKY